jgi:Transposase IS66 family
VIAHDLFTAWESYQADTDRARLQAQIAPLQDKLRAILEHASRKSPRTKYHRQFARNLLNRWPALWTFTHTPGVEPTNNHAERGLRGAVIYRKLSLGSQSDQGERTIERLLSASLTCRLQRRSLFAYLTDVLTARIRGDPSPRSPDRGRDLNAYTFLFASLAHAPACGRCGARLWSFQVPSAPQRTGPVSAPGAVPASHRSGARREAARLRGASRRGARSRYAHGFAGRPPRIRFVADVACSSARSL